MTNEELTEIFLTKLDSQGFNIDSIRPWLILADREEDAYQVRFEVEYPGLRPICQYVNFDGETCTPRDEWFLPGDLIFNYDEGKTITSFYNAFKHTATTFALRQHLEIAEPWCKPSYQLELTGETK